MEYDSWVANLFLSDNASNQARVYESASFAWLEIYLNPKIQIIKSFLLSSTSSITFIFCPTILTGKLVLNPISLGAINEQP